MIPVLLTNQSPGAPELTGSPGALYQVIKWAAQEIGWTIAFDDPANQRIALQSSENPGNGFFYVIYDDAEVTGDSRRAEIRGAVFMDGFDDIDTPFPALDVTSYIYKSNNTTDSRPYLIVATTRHFYIAIQGRGINSTWAYFFGDYAGLSDADAPKAMVVSSESTTASLVERWGGISSGANTSQSTGHWQAFSWDGLTSPHPAGANSPALTSSQEMGGETSRTYPHPFGADIITERVIVVEPGAIIRGQFPGMLGPNELSEDNQSDLVTGDIVEGIHNGHQLIDAVLVQTNYAFSSVISSRWGAFLLDVTSDWDEWL